MRVRQRDEVDTRHCIGYRAPEPGNNTDLLNSTISNAVVKNKNLGLID